MPNSRSSLLLGLQCQHTRTTGTNLLSAWRCPLGCVHSLSVYSCSEPTQRVNNSQSEQVPDLRDSSLGVARQTLPNTQFRTLACAWLLNNVICPNPVKNPCQLTILRVCYRQCHRWCPVISFRIVPKAKLHRYLITLRDVRRKVLSIVYRVRARSIKAARPYQ